MARAQGTFNFSANFETLVSGTLDARQMVDNFADLLNFTSSNFIKNGFFVAVSGEVNPSERGLYYCNNANDLSSATSWTKLSTSESSFSGDYNDLTNKPTLFSGSYNDLTDTPTLFSGDYTDLTNKPVLFSGAYSDLTGKPTLFSGSYNDLTDTPNLFSGDYNDLSNIPATFNVADDSITEPKLSPDVRTKLNETVGAGGYAANVYFSNATSTTDANYRQLSYEDDATATIIDTVVNNNEVIVDEFIFDGDALIDKIPSGVWSFNSYTKVSQENAVTKLRFEVFTRQSGGGETVLFSFDSQEINNNTFEMISNQVSKPSYTINPTDRLGVKVYANTTRTSNVTVSFEIGNGNASYVNAPLQIRHSQLRGTDEPNSHPISAITGLQSELDSKEESFTKNTAFNKNFGTASDTVAEGNDSRIINGQTAFSWGDHSTEGYLTSYTETDPTVPSHVKAITTGEITNWNAAYNEKINSLTITGDANKTVTLTQQDGTTLTANFNDNNDGNGTDIKINTLDFNTTNGILTATRDDAVEVTTDLDGRYSLLNHTHTISEIVDFPTDVSFFNNDAGYITTFTDTYVINSTFNNSNGILSLERNNGLPTITVDLDGRYSQTDTTYSPGTGLSLVGTTFNVDNPFNPNGDYTNLRARSTTAADVGLGNLPNWTSGTFDSRYVNTSGNESISGDKTFTGDIEANNFIGNGSQLTNLPINNNLPNFSTILPNSIGTVYTAASTKKVREIGNIIKSTQDGFYYQVITDVNTLSSTQNVKLLKSSDLITWTDEGNIVSDSEDPYLVENNGTYYLYVEDKAPTIFRNIKLYTSTNLTTWTDEGVVFDRDLSSDWESQDVSSPVVFIENGTWYLYYEGRNSSPVQDGAIGLATSNDGINWTRFSTDPIVTGTNLNGDVSWANHIVPDDIIKIDSLYYMTAHANTLPDSNPDNEWYNAILVSNDLENWVDMLGTWTNRVNYTDESGFGTMIYNSEEYGILASFVNEGNAVDQDQKELIFGSFGFSQNFDIKEKTIKSRQSIVDYTLEVGENEYQLPTPYFNEDFSTGIGDFTLGGDNPWVRVTDEGNSGTTSLKSGTINNRESSTLTLNITTTSEITALVFDYKTSTEQDFDFLEVRIDGADIKAYSGINSWSTSEILFIKGIGNHTIEWNYWRDNSAGGGSNEVWIDNVKLYNDYLPSVDIDGSTNIGKDLNVQGTGVFKKLSVSGDFHVNGKHKAFDSLGNLIFQMEPNSLKTFGTNKNKAFDLIGGNSTRLSLNNSQDVEKVAIDTGFNSNIPYFSLLDEDSEMFIGSNISNLTGTGYSLTTAKSILSNNNVEVNSNNYFKADNTWIRDNGAGISVISQNDLGGGAIFFRPRGDSNSFNEMTLGSSGNLLVNGTADFMFKSNSYYGNSANNPMIYFGDSNNSNAIIHRASGTGQNFNWRSSSNTTVATLDADNGDFETNGDVIAFSSSDINLKENIVNIDSPLEKIKKLNGVYFDWIESDKRHNHKGKDVGVIAQEVEKVLPEIVTIRKNDVKAVQYDKLIPLAIEAIKEQDKKIEDLETRLEKLEKLIK